MIYMYMINGHVTHALDWLVHTMDNRENFLIDNVEKIHFLSVSFLGENRLDALCVILSALMNE